MNITAAVADSKIKYQIYYLQSVSEQLFNNSLRYKLTKFVKASRLVL